MSEAAGLRVKRVEQLQEPERERLLSLLKSWVDGFEPRACGVYLGNTVVALDAGLGYPTVRGRKKVGKASRTYGFSLHREK